MNFKISKIFMIILEKVFPSHYLSMVLRLRKSDSIGAKPDVSDFKGKVAIVMQGPIVIKDNFTYETLKIYKKRFPEIVIILSTWDNYSKDELTKFKKINVEIIENTKPNYFGIFNINLQIESTKNGVLKANELGAKYCLKTRTDQRIYRHDFIQFFISLLDLFPIRGHKMIRGRLISVSLNTLKYRLYGVTDMLTFGFIEDMVLYWSAEHDKRTLEEINVGSSVEDWGRSRICEVYLVTQYLEKIGHNPIYTIKDSWRVFGDYFCIIDQCSIDLFWFKYNRWSEGKRHVNSKRGLSEELTFSDWINLVNDLTIYNKSDEIFLKKENMSNI
jgi:hypothetical protein